MSDPNYGEPVDDNGAEKSESVDDVVGRAHEGLAEAEAASRDAVSSEELAAADAGETADTAGRPDDTAGAGVAGAGAAGAAGADADRADSDAGDAPAGPAEPAAETVATPTEPSDDDLEAAYAEAGYAPEPEPVADSRGTESAAAGAAAASVADEPLYRGDSAPGTATYGEVTPSEPVATGAATGATAAYAAQPIFVQAPEAPRPRGNRAAAGAIGLLAALSFGLLYLAAALGVGFADGSITGENVGAEALGALTTWWFWVPVAVFFLGFWLLGAILNRGRWGYWVIFGLVVGFIAYGGHILGQLFQAPFWTLTASQGAELVEGQLFAPLAIAAFLIGRELTIWFGAWVASRGKRVTELNYEAQREYERTLEAGPQLHQG